MKEHTINIVIPTTIETPEELGLDVEQLRAEVQAALVNWSDGRYPFEVEKIHDGCARLVEHALNVVLNRMARAIVRPDDTSWFDAPKESWILVMQTKDALRRRINLHMPEDAALATGGRYRVICESTVAEGAPRDGYELATRKTFETYAEAYEYASGINSSRRPRIVVEVSESETTS